LQGFGDFVPFVLVGEDVDALQVAIDGSLAKSGLPSELLGLSVLDEHVFSDVILLAHFSQILHVVVLVAQIVVAAQF